MKIGIISYCDKIRTFASVNHQYYADRHGYTYIYDIAPTHHEVFKNKVEKLIKFVDLFDYIFWIDDDAFFTNFSQPLEPFIKKGKKSDLIYCASPKNNGIWTYISSGNFFLKNTRKTKDFLRAVLDTPLEEVEAKWNKEKYGHYTIGDQDIMTHLLFTDKRFLGKKFHVALPYEEFNTRPFHFNKKLNEHFLVHFTGKEKYQQSLKFAQKFEMSPALIPMRDYHFYKGMYSPVNGHGNS